MKKFIHEVNAFYPGYLKAHSDRGNQVLHFIGATCFFSLLAMAFVLPEYWLIGLAIFCGYLFPGLGHRFFQHNDSFRSTKPVLCVVCAFRLYADTLSLQVGRKLKAVTNGELRMENGE